MSLNFLNLFFSWAQIWSEFMNRSGEEQDRFLAEVEEGMIRVAKKASLEQDKNGNSFTMVDAAPKKQAPVEVKDKRTGKTGVSTGLSSLDICFVFVSALFVCF